MFVRASLPNLFSNFSRAQLVKLFFPQIKEQTKESAAKKERIVAVLDSGIFKDHPDLQCEVCMNQIAILQQQHQLKNTGMVKGGHNFVTDRDGGMYDHNTNYLVINPDPIKPVVASEISAFLNSKKMAVVSLVPA